MDPKKEKQIEEYEKIYNFAYGTIMKYKGEEERLVIPDKIPHHKAPSECGFVLIHDIDRVVTVGDHAFYDCLSLKSVVFPDSLRAIGVMAFSDCVNLEHIVLPDGLEKIRIRAFYNCACLKSVTIPDSVTAIDEEAFGCTLFGKIPNFTIRGSKDSEAERCAKENGFIFVEVN